MLTSADKIQLTQYPALPSKCPVCNRGSDGSIWFIDFGLSYDYEGTVTPCVDCWKSAAELVAYVPYSDIAPLLQDKVDLTEVNERLEEERDKLQRALDSLLAVRSRPLRGDSGSYGSASAATDKDDQQLELPIGEQGENDSEFAESATGSRSKNFPQSGIEL